MVQTLKKLSVEQWTLVTLNKYHLGYIADGEGPATYFLICENGGGGCIVGADGGITQTRK